MEQIQQILNQLRNLLKLQNNSKATNLIPKELQVSQVQTDEDKVKKFLLIFSTTLCVTTGIIALWNYNLESENSSIREGLNNSVLSYEFNSIDKGLINNRIENIKRFNEINNQKAVYTNFLKFTENLFLGIGTRNILSFQTNRDNNKFNFKIVFNTTNQSITQDLQRRLESDKLLKELKQSSIKFNQSLNNYEIEITGVYESK